MKKWLLLALTFILSSCGFHLKGTSVFDTPLPYRSWQIEGGSMQRALETVLRRQPNVIVNSDNPDVVVKVISASQDMATAAVDISGSTSEYLLTLEVKVQAYRHGQPLGEPIIVNIRRYMEYSDHEVLAKENERNIIWRDIQTDAAEQIVHRLAYLPIRADQ